MEGEARLPVTIVTGFLGSGKTTLVNHILAQQHGLRIAVMVNEIGDLAIDNELIIGAAGDMVELSNGCICCSINNDLVDAVFRVLRNQPPVEYLIVETTGLADPLPIVLTFLRSEFRDAVRVDSIVTVADAENFNLDLFAGRAAANQLRYADFVLLNKCDLATPAQLDAVETKIRAIAGGVRIARTMRAEIALPLILGAGTFRSGRTPGPERGRPEHDDAHDHLAADGFGTVSFANERAFAADKFQAFLEGLPANVFRAKGVLTIAGAEQCYAFHLVGKRFTLDPAAPGIARGNRLVVIGRNLDPAGLRAQLRDCLAD